MKVAHCLQGNIVYADADAPKQARCPHCGGNLVLRSRKIMRSTERSYYWRHQGNSNMRCNARSRPSFLSH